MKIEEAIQTLKDIYPSQKQIVTGEYPHVADSIDLAIDALEKQTRCGCRGAVQGLRAL